MNYTWNVKTLEKRVRQLQRRKKHTLNPIEKNRLNIEILNLVDSIDSFKPKKIINYQSLPLIDRLKEEDILLDPYFWLWKYVFDFVNIIKTEDEFLEPKQSFLLTKEDIIELTHDFYQNTLDSSLQPFFQKAFNDRFDHIRFSNNPIDCGSTLYIPSLNESFIESQYLQNFSDVITLIHEFAHTIHFRVNFNQQDGMDLWPFWEYFSLFIENIAFDYFSNGSTFSKSAIRDKQMEWTCYKNDAYDISLILKILHMLDNTTVYNNRHLKLLVWQNLNITENSLENLLSSSKSNLFSYIISYLLVIELLTLYYQDKDKCWHIAKQILAIESDSSYDFYYQLSNLGISLNEHTKEFEQRMQLERKRLYEHV